jgi:hypothetical protein
MEVLFGILVGLTIAFIYVNWKNMNKPSDNKTNTTNNGGGYTSVNDGVAGELPKDNIK